MHVRECSLFLRVSTYSLTSHLGGLGSLKRMEGHKTWGPLIPRSLPFAVARTIPRSPAAPLTRHRKSSQQPLRAHSKDCNAVAMQRDTSSAGGAGTNEKEEGGSGVAEAESNGAHINAVLLDNLCSRVTATPSGGSLGVHTVTHTPRGGGTPPQITLHTPGGAQGGAVTGAITIAATPTAKIANCQGGAAASTAEATPKSLVRKMVHQTPCAMMSGGARAKGRVLRDESPSLLPPPTFEVTKFLEQVPFFFFVSPSQEQYPPFSFTHLCRAHLLCCLRVQGL